MLYSSNHAINLLSVIGYNLEENLKETFKEEYEKYYDELKLPNFPEPINFIIHTGFIYALITEKSNDEQIMIKIVRDYYNKLFTGARLERIVALYPQRN